MLSWIQASHGVSQRTMGMRRLRRRLRHVGSRRASVQRSACVSLRCTRPARTVVAVSVSRIKPLLLLRGSRGCSEAGVGCHAQGGIMLGTHGSSRRESVSGQTGRSWPAGGVDARRGLRCEAVRGLHTGGGRQVELAPARLPGENDGAQVYKHGGPYASAARYHTAHRCPSPAPTPAPAPRPAVCIVSTARTPSAIAPRLDHPPLAMATASSQNYDYLRRKQSTKAPGATTITPVRKPARTPSERNSNGTVSSYGTTQTNNTNVTEPPSFSKKLVVVGDGGCGKTCLLISYSSGNFPEACQQHDTLSLHLANRRRNTYRQSLRTTSPRPRICRLARWSSSLCGILLARKNTTACDRSPTQRPTLSLFVSPSTAPTRSKTSWTRYAAHFLLLVARTNSSQWYPEVLHFCPTTPLMLLGLKSDLRNKKNCIELLKTQGLTPVTPDQGRAVAKKMGAMYMECSSKEQDGVEDIFDTAVTIAVGDEWKTPADTRRETATPSAPGHHRTISTMSDLPKKKKKSKGCTIL